MNLDEMQRIAEMMEKHELTEFYVMTEDMKIRMKRGVKMVSGPVPQAQPMAPPPPPGSGATSAAEAEEGGEGEIAGEVIQSPIVGTFYSAAAPDAEPFVKEGDSVTDDTVVCIVEAMKVMNEIKAEKRGKIKRVLVENATPVEFGQPLFELE